MNQYIVCLWLLYAVAPEPGKFAPRSPSQSKCFPVSSSFSQSSFWWQYIRRAEGGIRWLLSWRDEAGRKLTVPTEVLSRCLLQRCNWKRSKAPFYGHWTLPSSFCLAKGYMVPPSKRREKPSQARPQKPFCKALFLKALSQGRIFISFFSLLY